MEKCPVELNLEDENEGFDCTVTCVLESNHSSPLHIAHRKGERAFFAAWIGDDRSDIYNTFCPDIVEDWIKFWEEKVKAEGVT